MVEDSEDGGIEPNAVLLDEREDGHGGQCFRDAGQAKDRLGPHCRAVLHRSEPIASSHDELAVLGDRQAGAGDSMPMHDQDHGPVDRLKAGAGLACDRFFLRSRAAAARASKRDRGQSESREKIAPPHRDFPCAESRGGCRRLDWRVYRNFAGRGQRNSLYGNDLVGCRRFEVTARFWLDAAQIGGGSSFGEGDFSVFLEVAARRHCASERSVRERRVTR